MGLTSKNSGAPLRVDRAENLRREGLLQEALEVIKRCLHEYPGHPRATLVHGRILYQGGMFSQSLRVLGPMVKSLGENEGLRMIIQGLEALWEGPKPPMDPAFVTETMAELSLRQGYLWDAMEIYRQIYLISASDGLWQKIIRLKDRLERKEDRQKDGGEERVEALNHWIESRQRDL